MFLGVPIGLSGGQPTTDVAGTELRIPIRPVSSGPGFGSTVAGFLVRVTDAPDAAATGSVQ